MSKYIADAPSFRSGDYHEQFVIAEDAPSVQQLHSDRKTFQPRQIKLSFSCSPENGWQCLVVMLSGPTFKADGSLGVKYSQQQWVNLLPDEIEENLPPQWVQDVIAERLALLRAEALQEPASAPQEDIEPSQGLQHYREAERLVSQAHHYTYGDGADAVTGHALAAEAQAHATLALVAATVATGAVEEPHLDWGIE